MEKSKVSFSFSGRFLKAPANKSAARLAVVIKCVIYSLRSAQKVKGPSISLFRVMPSLATSIFSRHHRVKVYFVLFNFIATTPRRKIISAIICQFLSRASIAFWSVGCVFFA
jgi:hypothetical protein